MLMHRFASILLALMLSLAAFSPALAAPPNNDDIASATVIGSLPYTDSVDNTEATLDPNEPRACNDLSRTIWYSFTPATDAILRADMDGSIYPYTNLSIYEWIGPGPFDLMFLTCATFGGSPSVSFRVQAGTTYYLQASSLYGTSGLQQVNLYEVNAPPNDSFSNAIPVQDFPFTDTVDLAAAGTEPFEPTPSCAPVQVNRTVWYALTPAQDVSLSATVVNPPLQPLVVVYTGNSLTGLTEMGCTNQYNGLATFRALAGITYYLQIGAAFDQVGYLDVRVDVAPPPQVDFYLSPDPPSIFSPIQFCDLSNDPGQAGFQEFTWDFGDGTSSTGGCVLHQYASDGDYTVNHSVTTTDGRTASISRVIEVRTHDVSIVKVSAPRSASAGQSKPVTVSIRNTRYPEMVRVDLYKTAPTGEVWIDTLFLPVPVTSGNRTTQFVFNYTFTAQDALIGKVSFRAAAFIEGANDAFPQDNIVVSLPPTRVSR